MHIVFQHETAAFMPVTPGGTTRALQINVDVELVSGMPPMFERRHLYMSLGEILITNRLSGFQRGLEFRGEPVVADHAIR